MARLALPLFQLLDNNGDPLSGGKLNFYSTGTSTPKDTFSDDALTTANANPVVADSAGRFADIFLESGTYKVVLTDSLDVVIWTADPVTGSLGSSGAVDTITTGYTVTLADATKVLAVDATAGDVTITLLASATAGDGFALTVIKTDTSINTVTIDGNGAETIDGVATLVLTAQYQGAGIRSDASNWLTTTRYSPSPSGAKGPDIASAATIVIPNGFYFDITGTTGITAITVAAERYFVLQFDGVVLLTHHATNLNLPAGVNYTTKAGDRLLCFATAASQVHVVSIESGGGLPRGYKSGMRVSNGTDTDHDIDITAGERRSADDSEDIVLSAMTKQGDATWSAGTAAGGLSSSLTALANDTWYHVFAINVGGSADVGFDTDPDATNLIADHTATAHRWIGAVKTDGSANFKQFHQFGLDEFWWDYDEVANAEHTVTNVGANGTAVALDNIPDGITTIAMIGVAGTGGGSTHVYGAVRGDKTITASPSVGDSIAMSDFANTTISAAFFRVPADSSQQVKLFSSLSTSDYDITVWGWVYDGDS